MGTIGTDGVHRPGPTEEHSPDHSSECQEEDQDQLADGHKEGDADEDEEQDDRDRADEDHDALGYVGSTPWIGEIGCIRCSLAHLFLAGCSSGIEPKSCESRGGGEPTAA